jgi:hypothetical protein
MKEQVRNLLLLKDGEVTVTRCTNPLCGLASDKLKRMKSQLKKMGEYLDLCERCAQYYSKGNYCDFCEQIYGSTSEEYRDVKMWIQCDGCRKWVGGLNSFDVLKRTTWSVRQRKGTG